MVPQLADRASVRPDFSTVRPERPYFGRLPAEQRARVWMWLGNAYASAGQHDPALDALRRPVQVDPQSRSGKEASDRPHALITNVPNRPDRFPHIASDASPLLVVVTFTRPSAAADGTQAQMIDTTIIRLLDGTRA